MTRIEPFLETHRGFVDIIIDLDRAVYTMSEAKAVHKRIGRAIHDGRNLEEDGAPRDLRSTLSPSDAGYEHAESLIKDGLQEDSTVVLTQLAHMASRLDNQDAEDYVLGFEGALEAHGLKAGGA